MKLNKSAVLILFAGTLMGLSGCATEFGQKAISSNGGILPPEQTWSLDTADEFDGPNIDSRLWPSGSGGDVPERSGVCYDNARSIRFSNGIMIMDTWDTSSVPSCQGVPGGGFLETPKMFGPGYYEARVDGGSGWGGFWSMSSFGNCDPPTKGFEADIFEISPTFAPAGQNLEHYGGYSACHQQGDAYAQLGSTIGQFDIYGMRWLSSGITFYKNGKVTSSSSNFPYVQGVSSLRSVIIDIEYPFGIGPDITPGHSQFLPIRVDWFRFYKCTSNC
jgi:hypothetical protein